MTTAVGAAAVSCRGGDGGEGLTAYVAGCVGTGAWVRANACFAGASEDGPA